MYLPLTANITGRGWGIGYANTFPGSFTKHYSWSTDYGRFDIHPDGERFPGVDVLGAEKEYAIKVTVNREQELQSK